MNYIEIQGITTHNLKNIDINIEKNKITAIYGRSGAGKSSLAFSNSVFDSFIHCFSF